MPEIMKEFHAVVNALTWLNFYRGDTLASARSTEGHDMNARRNKLMMEGIFEAIGRGDRSAYEDALHDDVVMQVMGSSSWAQTVRGKTKVLDVFFRHHPERPPGPGCVAARPVFTGGPPDDGFRLRA
jgi:hypothetical protein